MFESKAVNDNEVVENVSLPFFIEKDNVRGRFVRLASTCNKIIKGHNYPVSVSKLLSEILAVTTLLGTTLKAEGMVTLQVQGDGPVSFIVSDLTHSGHLRGYANIKAGMESKLSDPDTPISEILGNGYLVISIENDLSPERYQGIVRLEGKTIAESVTKYFEQSVQRDTSIQVFTAYKKFKKRKAAWYCGGIMLQRIPESSKPLHLVNEFNADILHEEAVEGWRRANAFLDTVSGDELINPNIILNETLYRLFHEDDVRVFDAQKIIAKCRCSRKKVKFLLDNMSQEELDSLKENDDKIVAKCQFCSKEYRF